MQSDNRGKHSRRRIFFVAVAFLAIAISAGFPFKRTIAPASAQKQLPNVPALAPGSAYRQTNFLSDIPGLAPIEDPLLINPWGIAVRGSSPFWIANNGSSTTQLVRGDVGGAPVVLNPSPQTVNIVDFSPTGAVGNSTSDFKIPPPGGGSPAAALFIFGTETGYIDAWNGASGAVTQSVRSKPGHVYTGLAIGANSGGNHLYAADFANNHIDVFDGTFADTTVSGGFIDPTVPSDYHVFNIQNLGGSLYVSYAKFDGGEDVVNGAGEGFVRKFDTDGVRDAMFTINNGGLDAPWGLTFTPSTFGIFGGSVSVPALLVGNFAEEGRINAFNGNTGAFLGTMRNENNDDIVIPYLWALQFGNGGNGGDVNTLYFTSGIGDENHGLFGKLNPTTAQATSLVEFATDNFSVDEGGGHVDFTVIRTGDTSGTATVNYNTFDEFEAGHANQKADYEISLGKITFNPGETSKTFRILIVDDKFEEGDETINLALSNPTGTGVGMGSPSFAELKILDNDTMPGSENPIDNATFFVRQHYLDFLNREPDLNASALISEITSCGADPSCINSRRASVSSTFFTSLQFLNTGTLISRTYQAAFGPTTPGSTGPVLYGEFELGLQAMQKDTDTTAEVDPPLEANIEAFFAGFVAGPRFVARFPTTQTPAQFVDALFLNAGVTPSSAERQAAIDEFGAAPNTSDQSARARALRRVAENASFTHATAASNAVLLSFFAYMRRDPDAATFNQILTQLNSLGADINVANIIRAFITSPEYRQRFGVDEGFGANTAPVANADSATTNSITPVTINVLANDSDFEGDFLTITAVTPGTGGTPTISSDHRSILFTSAPGFAGSANFQYTITDNGWHQASPMVFLPDPKTATATVTVTVNSAGTFQFTADSTSVNENAGKVTLTVTLVGGTTAPVTVDYATAIDPPSLTNCAVVNNFASERCDYNTAISTLRFGPGESSKSFDVFITDDARVEGNETFTVRLENPTGTNFSVGGSSIFTVTIVDNDSSPSSTNPIDGIPFFVRQLYVDFLSRDPDTTGFNNYVNTLNGCPGGGFGLANPGCDRVRAAISFYQSPEFGERGYLVYRFYDAALGRVPQYREFVRDLRRIGGAASPSESEAAKTILFQDYVASAEFQSIYAGLTDSAHASQFVAKLEQTAGVTLPEPFRSNLISQMQGGTLTAPQVLRQFIEHSVVFNKFFNRGFVSMLYFGLLRRNPDTLGFQNWLNQLNTTGNQRSIVFGFIYSTEYRSRFGQP